MSNPAVARPSTAIHPSQVRYIKLGGGGEWENECIEKGIIRFGFGTANDERFALCRAGNWDELTKSLIAEGRAKGTATNITNKTPEVEQAVATLEQVRISVRELVKLLGPRDFEILIDLIFSSSGWRRLGVVGKTQKTLDLDIMLPSTGERAFVQVKSKTTSAELAKYVGKLEDHGPYDRMFFVFHSGEADTDDDRVSVVGPDKLAELVVDAGLVNWLIQKVS